MKHFIIFCAIIIAGFLSHAKGYEQEGKIIGEVHIGIPAYVNIGAGWENHGYGFKIAGLYSGNDETNSYWWNNGIHLDAYKYLNQIGPFGHKISALIGYAEINRSYSKRWAYAAVGYTLQWKVIYMQGGVGGTLLKSNYAIDGFFPFLNMGVSFKLFLL